MRSSNSIKLCMKQKTDFSPRKEEKEEFFMYLGDEQ